MKTLIVLIAINLVRAGLLQDGSADYTYSGSSTGSRISDDTSISSVPALVAVRKGSGYSATDNVLLRSEDITSILNSGNYVSFQAAADPGKSPVTYAAIPVVRNGNTYSVANENLASLRQSTQSLGLNTETITQFGSSAAPSFAVRAQDATLSQLQKSTNSNQRFATSFATSSDSSLNRDGIDVSSPFDTSRGSSSLSYDDVTRTTSGSKKAAVVSTIRSFGNNAARADSYGSSATRLAPVTNNQISSGGNTNSISVVSSNFVPTLSAPRNPGTFAGDSARTAPVSLTRSSASSFDTNALSVNTVQSPASFSRNAGSSSNSYTAVRTAIASAPGLLSTPLVLGNTGRSSSLDRYLDVIPGVPFQDYPIYDKVPATRFNCREQSTAFGYFADPDAGCQLYHVCNLGRKFSFICPNGTLFDQRTRVCDWWYNVDCDSAPSFYDINADIGIVPFRSSSVFPEVTRSLVQQKSPSASYDTPQQVAPAPQLRSAGGTY